MIIDTETPTIFPFLRWAGGKRWLSKKILEIIPASFNYYHEPFLGSAAIFFAIKPQRAFLSDLNDELINTYKQVRRRPDKIVSYLKNLKNTKECYEQVKYSTPTSLYEKAANFIFLNKTSYNGIYRVNSSGKYNVPYGDNNYKEFVIEDNFIKVSEILQNSTLYHSDFLNSLDYIEKKDLVYLDPPYTVSHSNNGFIEYNRKIFSWEDQEKLSEYVSRLNSKGAYFILSNAFHPSILDLYKKFGKIIIVDRISTVGGKFSKRMPVQEYLFTNCK
jgi:DNA adenine methylase